MSNMKNELHLVLGGHGAIGRAVTKELLTRKIPVKAVERSKDAPGVETIRADLLDPEQSVAAIRGSSYVYLCVGLKYNSKVWAADWPKVMENVISACQKANAKLVFFDNVYSYGPPPLSIPFNESHPQDPASSKGKTRKLIAEMLLEAHKKGRVEAVIGRSADFYGPNATNSPLYISILERMLKGKAPQSIAKSGKKHTYAFTEDNGRALVSLALDDSTYGQVWHLPVGKPITIEEVTAYFNKELATDFKTQFIQPLTRKILSLFIPMLKENEEMLYQFDSDYVMSYEKFRKHFPNFKVTSYEDGIKEMTRSFKN
jgi:nucleoside-diphosphate-sugar epimerase